MTMSIITSMPSGYKLTFMTSWPNTPPTMAHTGLSSHIHCLQEWLTQCKIILRAYLKQSSGMRLRSTPILAATTPRDDTSPPMSLSFSGSLPSLASRKCCMAVTAESTTGIHCHYSHSLTLYQEPGGWHSLEIACWFRRPINSQSLFQRRKCTHLQCGKLSSGQDKLA